ncbi:PREDICTED: phylloquinone omega-hydroxylase CYP4F11-like [Hipposideros armiger]|uniref:Phylloquinone omega-hydroxylase CYP4F11-like n=1 Tax=Hipposideros armiger TaxID=186990 RepID=A0A8B7QPR3_HIPAR|nr:PREDICTED: phylloquinone omega-hydroxylase CYP4F11-like [Hipposideros armiger]
MLQLSLSWLGLGPLAASPWQLLLLVGASWLLARFLAWAYTFYGRCCRLRCFPQPPRRNWFWGHLGQVTPTEQGLRTVTQLITTYPHGFMTWQGPIMPLIILCHPDMVRAITNASGTHTELDPALFPSFLSATFLFSLCIQACLLPLIPSVPFLLSWTTLVPQ